MLVKEKIFDPVRLWSKKDLRRVRSGMPRDRAIATAFLNAKTFSAEEMLAYPYWLRKTYVADLASQAEPIVFYATDDEMAREYLEEKYSLEVFPLISLEEKTTSYRGVYEGR